MKHIITLILALFTLAAHAETIPLVETTCGAVRNCNNVAADPNDVDLFASTAYSTLTLYVNGVAYAGPNTPSDVLLYSADGQWARLQAVFTTSRHLVRVGRGQRWVTTYTLTGGSVERP
jgi:hypothetical protein